MTNYNPLNLNGKKYLVTGAASGIGRATSILLSKLGADLLLVDINQEELLKTEEACVSNIETLTFDLSDVENLKNALFEKISQFGKINGLAHIAGKSCILPLKMLSEKMAYDVWKLNTYAAVELSKIFINNKIYAGEMGSIVFISSVYGLVGSAANVAYAMSKGGIISTTKALAIELASKNIRVNCIAPGFIKTPMMDRASGNFNDDYVEKINSLHPLGLGEADDVANAIAFLFSDMSKWITGAVLNVDGGFTAQ